MQFLPTGSSNLICGIVEGRLERFRNGGIALPAFVLEDDQLNGDGSGVGVQLRERLVFRDPAPEDLVREGLLSCLVEKVENDVLAKIREGHLGTRSGMQRPNLVGPLFELEIVCSPRSRIIASYSVRPGDLRLELGSPPSRCFTTSVVRFKGLTLEMPATYLPSHLTRNLKFL